MSPVAWYPLIHWRVCFSVSGAVTIAAGTLNLAGVVTYWLADTSDEFADTTQLVDLSLGVLVQALRGGVVDYIDAGRVVIRVNDDEATAGEVGVDIYNLIKYTRSNQNTNINQRPIVKVGDRVANLLLDLGLGLRLERAQDADRLLDRGLLDLHLMEAAPEGVVLLDEVLGTHPRRPSFRSALFSEGSPVRTPLSITSALVRATALLVVARLARLLGLDRLRPRLRLGHGFDYAAMEAEIRDGVQLLSHQVFSTRTISASVMTPFMRTSR